MGTLYDLLMKEFNFSVLKIQEQVKCYHLDFISELTDERKTYTLKVGYKVYDLEEQLKLLNKFSTVDILLNDFRVSNKSVIILNDNSYYTLEINNELFRERSVKLIHHKYPGIPVECR